MRYSDTQRQQIINKFLDHCERIGFTPDNCPLQVYLIDGLPVKIDQYKQSIRFDVDLTNSKQNATMD